MLYNFMFCCFDVTLCTPPGSDHPAVHLHASPLFISILIQLPCKVRRGFVLDGGRLRLPCPVSSWYRWKCMYHTYMMSLLHELLGPALAATAPLVRLVMA